MTLVSVEVYIGYVMKILRSHAPKQLALHLNHNRYSVISNTSSASGCRPDSYFIVNERLLLVGEDKVNSDEVSMHMAIL